MIYLSSDLHFGHNKSFLYEPRGFSSIEKHDEEIIKNWNSIVNYDDEVYLLGDLMLGDNIEGINKLRRLNGHKNIILGNHDSQNRKELYEELYNTEVLGWSMPFKHNGYIFYLSHYPSIVSNYSKDKPLRHRVINLCGHSHTKDKWQDWDKGLIYHCELDAHDNKPILLDNIIKEIERKIEKEKR